MQWDAFNNDARAHKRRSRLMKFARSKETGRVQRYDRKRERIIGNVTRINSRIFNGETQRQGEMGGVKWAQGQWERCNVYGPVDIIRDNKVYIAQNRESCITT